MYFRFSCRKFYSILVLVNVALSLAFRRICLPFNDNVVCPKHVPKKKTQIFKEINYC